MPSAAVEIKLMGFRELERRLAVMPAKIERACFRKALRSTLTKGARRIRAGTPRSGESRGVARGSVKVKVQVRRGSAWGTAGYTRQPKRYMRIYEAGSTRSTRQPARHFFRQAVAGFERDAQAEFVAALQSAVEKNEG